MWTAIAIVAVVLLYFIVVYNGLVSRRNQVREAWATIDTQLKRRYDLIPNLMETVSGAAKHEKETLNAVLQRVIRQCLRGGRMHVARRKKNCLGR